MNRQAILLLESRGIATETFMKIFNEEKGRIENLGHNSDIIRATSICTVRHEFHSVPHDRLIAGLTFHVAPNYYSNVSWSRRHIDVQRAQGSQVQDALFAQT